MTVTMAFQVLDGIDNFRCGCGRVVLEGQPYGERPDGMIGANLVTSLCCVYCEDTPQVEQAPRLVLTDLVPMLLRALRVIR